MVITWAQVSWGFSGTWLEKEIYLLVRKEDEYILCYGPDKTLKVGPVSDDPTTLQQAADEHFRECIWPQVRPHLVKQRRDLQARVDGGEADLVVLLTIHQLDEQFRLLDRERQT